MRRSQKHLHRRPGDGRVRARPPWWLAFVLAAFIGCARNTQLPGETAPSREPQWLTDPCLDDSIDDFGWTLYELRSIRVRVPRQFERRSAWNPDLLWFRRNNSALTLQLNRDGPVVFLNLARPQMGRPSVCEAEIGGFVAHVMSYKSRKIYTYAILWPHRMEIGGVGKYLIALIRTPDPDDATALRRALLTVKLPQGLK
jgi:hypothetical protein